MQFQMCDVSGGGATVFPDLHVAVPPRKGTAIFWYDSDNKYKRLPYVSCPSLIGTKWSKLDSNYAFTLGYY